MVGIPLEITIAVQSITKACSNSTVTAFSSYSSEVIAHAVHLGTLVSINRLGCSSRLLVIHYNYNQNIFGDLFFTLFAIVLRA